jgi:SpoVK/Ycf46/Vps4 family AAA+-type ATPase
MFAPGEGGKGTKDPLVALKEIAINSGQPSIYVLKDFHPFMKDPGVVRALRDLANSLRTTYTSVVLLCPRMVLPDELEKDLTVVDFPLPSREELQYFFDQLAGDIADNPALRFEDNEETRQRLMDAAAGLTMNEVENVFAKILVRHGKLTAAEVPEVYHEKHQIIRKSGLMEYIDPAETIEVVGGLRTLKEWLRKRRRAFHPKARLFGLPVPKGVLFLGVQGCGKSLCAKAVSRFWQMPLLRLDMGALFEAQVGASEENIRQTIRIAESVAPAIVWIDEIDKGFSGLGRGADADAGTASRVFGTFLTWLQEKSAPVFVIATANNVEVLPPELLRQGRFDEIFFVDLPALEERREIFAIHLALRMRHPSRFDLNALARESEGFSGAEIEQAVVSGLYDAFDRQMDITQEILMGALKATRPLSVLMAEEIGKRRKWAQGRTRPAS